MLSTCAKQLSTLLQTMGHAGWNGGGVDIMWGCIKSKQAALEGMCNIIAIAFATSLPLH